jgi:splicing factor 3A subunit 3
MLLEDQRQLHEELERLELAISDRYLEDPKNVRERLRRDHETAYFLDRAHESAQRLVAIYTDQTDTYDAEVQEISIGDPYASFYQQYNQIKSYHQRYPNIPVENFERSFKRKAPGEDNPILSDFDSKFTGEEGFGRYFDLTMLHDLYVNLPSFGEARRPSYLEYIDIFDKFGNIKRSQKMTDNYFQYLGYLSGYLEDFMRRTKPLENFKKLFDTWDAVFEQEWAAGRILEWKEGPTNTDTEELKGRGDSIWCDDCEKEFTNVNVYEHHLSQKKHLKNVQARQAKKNNSSDTNGQSNRVPFDTNRLKEKAIAEREFRIQKLAAAMQTERDDTRHNVERRQGMTERERQQELAMLYAEVDGQDDEMKDDGNDSDEEGKLYNPLKLPIAWDGKPIPYWLYKLHGLGVEFTCEICGNYVYMGRRAFDKHFIEPRHIWGLKALGVTSTNLFREITSVNEAKSLWEKIQVEKKKERQDLDNVIQMEDGQGNVMPEKVYYDLQKQGLL